MDSRWELEVVKRTGQLFRVVSSEFRFEFRCTIGLTVVSFIQCGSRLKTKANQRSSNSWDDSGFVYILAAYWNTRVDTGFAFLNGTWTPLKTHRSNYTDHRSKSLLKTPADLSPLLPYIRTKFGKSHHSKKFSLFLNSERSVKQQTRSGPHARSLRETPIRTCVFSA